MMTWLEVIVGYGKTKLDAHSDVQIRFNQFMTENKVEIIKASVPIIIREDHDYSKPCAWNIVL
jgi:hypothetical protein